MLAKQIDFDDVIAAKHAHGRAAIGMKGDKPLARKPEQRFPKRPGPAARKRREIARDKPLAGDKTAFPNAFPHEFSRRVDRIDTPTGPC